MGAQNGHQNVIAEELLVIGRDESGQVTIAMPQGMNPELAVVLLEQAKGRLVQQVNFARESQIVPARLVPGGRAN